MNNLLGAGVLVDPALIVGGDIVPSVFELVADGPHEVALNVSVEDVHDAATEAGNLGVVIEGRVNGAFSLLDGGVV